MSDSEEEFEQVAEKEEKSYKLKRPVTLSYLKQFQEEGKVEKKAVTHTAKSSGFSSSLTSNAAVKNSISFSHKVEKKGVRGLDNKLIYEGDYVIVHLKSKVIGIVKFVDFLKLKKEDKEPQFYIVVEILDANVWSKYGGIKYEDFVEPNALLYKSQRSNTNCDALVKGKQLEKFMPPSFATNYEFMGYLTKQGSKIKNYKYRFFLLTLDSLYYFDSFSSLNKQLGKMDLMGATLEDVSAAEISNKSNFAFKIVNQKKDLIMFAHDEYEKTRWMKALRSTIDIATMRKQGKELLAKTMRHVAETYG